MKDPMYNGNEPRTLIISSLGKDLTAEMISTENALLSSVPFVPVSNVEVKNPQITHPVSWYTSFNDSQENPDQDELFLTVKDVYEVVEESLRKLEEQQP